MNFQTMWKALDSPKDELKCISVLYDGHKFCIWDAKQQSYGSDECLLDLMDEMGGPKARATGK